MKLTRELIDATEALVKPNAFHGVDRTRLGLVADVQSRGKELLNTREGTTLSDYQVSYLQCLRSRLQDFCLQTFIVSQNWLDAFADAYSKD